MDMIVQIYEIQTPSEAEAMIGIGVDHLGSVLLTASDTTDADLRDTVEAAQAAGCKSSLIPLFKEVDAISRSVDRYRPDILHLCDTLPLKTDDLREVNEAVERQRRVRERFPDLELMRSIPIALPGKADETTTLKLASMFEPISDWFLTDTLLWADHPNGQDEQPVQGFVGITGATCDWTVARSLVRESRIPVILAGGLGPFNVADGINAVDPAGVDSCTLTNAVDSDNKPMRFKKDPERVKAMVAAARNGR